MRIWMMLLAVTVLVTAICFVAYTSPRHGDYRVVETEAGTFKVQRCYDPVFRGWGDAHTVGPFRAIFDTAEEACEFKRELEEEREEKRRRETVKRVVNCEEEE